MQKSISVIVPVYNTERYLDRCIGSILDQIYSNFELILVDDGSTDESGLICEEYKKKDRRIRVIHQENKGLSETRNTGIDAAQGELFCFVDSDDFIHPEMLTRLLASMNRHCADIVSCDYKKVFEGECRHESKEVECEETIYSNIQALENLLTDKKKILVYVWNKLFKRELFSAVRFPAGRIHEDTFTLYKLLYLSDKIVCRNEKLYYYFQSNNSITRGDYSLKRGDQLDALKDRTDFFSGSGLNGLYNKSRLEYALAIIKFYQKAKYYNKADGKYLSLVLKRYRAEIINYGVFGSRMNKWNRVRLALFFVHPGLLTAAVCVKKITYQLRRTLAN